MAKAVRINRQLAEGILDAVQMRFESPDVRRDFADFLVDHANERFGQAILPRPGESLALSVMTPKTAALAFDRVYRIPALIDPVPESIAFYGATTPEMAWWAGTLLLTVAQDLDVPAMRLNGGPGSPEAERSSLRFICSELPTVLGTLPTIFHHTPGSQARDFPAGSQQVLTSAIRNVALVDERSLTWDQVLEFRQDQQARVKYRRLVRWIDKELSDQSPSAVEDAIAIRLDDYEWAVKKHGIKTMLGALSCLLDPKFIAGASAAAAASSLVAGGNWAALCAATLTVGRSAIAFGTAYVDNVDERRHGGYELAYLHDVRRQLGGSTAA